MEETSSKQPIQIREVLRPIKARLWLIVVCVALATALTYYHYSSQPKEYRASTSLYIGSSNPTQLLSSLGSDRTTSDLATLAGSSAVMRLAAKELAREGHPAAIAGSVSASPASGSDFVTVSAVAGSGVDAAALANADADAFVQNETNTIRKEAAQAIIQTQRALAALPNTVANATQRGELISTIQQMENVETAPSVGIQHVDPAFPPGAPFAPNPKKDAIFAFVIALMLTVAGAYGLERFDRRIRKIEDVERLYGYPVLAKVMRTRKPAPTADGVAALPDDLRESFRKLRTSLQLATINEPPKTLVVTSAIPREGKSTVTRNLALAYREAGLAVCVIDADLRRPSISGLFGVPKGSAGLTDVVTGDESLWGVLKHAEVAVPGLRTLTRLQDASGAGAAGAQQWSRSRAQKAEGAVETGSVMVLPSGPEPANPPVVLGSDQVRSILSELAEGFDLVLIDTSPLLAVSDAVPLLSVADGVVVVTRVGMTTRDAAEELVAQIRRVPGANLLGLVANDVHGRESGAYSYGYGYEYSRTRTTA